MSAHAFLDQLESQQLLDEAIISDLRRQVDGSTRAVNAETIAKLLVDNGHLTKFQATKLVSSLGDVSEQKAKEKKKRRRKSSDSSGSSKGSAKSRSKSKSKAAPPEDELGLQEEEELGLLEAEEEAEEGLQPLDGAAGQQPQQPQQPQPAGLQPLSPQGGLQPLGGEALQPLGGDALQPLGGGDALQPLGGDALDPVSAPGAPDALDEAAEEEPKKKRGPKKVVNRENLWDSPLLLVGGGLLLLLLLAGTYLFLSLTRGTAQEMFDVAEEDYRSQSYTAAISKYEKFLKKFPTDPNVSLANVRIGMARVRTAIENASDPQKGLDAARTELPKIENEEAFDEARAELSSLLPDLALKFAERADDATTIESAELNLNKIDEAMTLVNNATYIPTSTRREQAVRIDAIKELKDKVTREIGRNRSLAEAVAGMTEAVEAGNTAGAYAIRKGLMKKYPGLGAHPDLVAAVDNITARARSLVSNQPLGTEPLTTDDTSEPSTVKVMLAGNGGRSLPGADDHLALAKVDGSVFAVDAASGRALWRRFVGFDTEIEPLLLSDGPNADVLVADGVRHELVRLKATDGSVVWRLPLGAPFNQPTISADMARVIVATEDGSVAEVDTETGVPSVAAKIPQKLTVGPGHGDARRPMIYQVAEHDNLYVLNNDDLVCQQVYHLGHKQGTVAVPPVMAVGHVFVAVNQSPERCLLYVLAGDEKGQELTEAQPPIQLEGQVTMPLIVAGRRVAVVTDLGAVNILDVAPQKEDQDPVSDAVKPRVATFTQPTKSYALVENLRMWIGDTRLIHYEIQTAKQEFVQKEIGNQGDAFVAPLQHVARGLIHVRKPRGTPGVTMRAVNDRSIEETVWFTDLAVPAAKAMVHGNKVMVVSGRGRVYPITSESVTQGYAAPGAPPGENDLDTYFGYSSRLSSGVSVFVSDTHDWLAVAPDGRQQTAKMEGARGEIVAELAPMGRGVLVPQSAQISFVDATGKALAHPFQPKLEAGGEVQWRRPAVISDTQFVVTNDRKNLHLVGVNERGATHLGIENEVPLENEIVSPLAYHAGSVWGVTQTNAGDVLLKIDPLQLSLEPVATFEGRVTFGPRVVGDDLILTTTGDGLVCLDGEAKTRWTMPLTSALSAPPTLDGETYLMGLVEGRILRVDVATGRLLQAKLLSEPIRGEVLPYNERVVTTGVDGTLIVTTLLDVGSQAERPDPEATTYHSPAIPGASR